MSRDRDADTESRITTDSDTIRAWGERHTLVPVRHGTGDERRLDVVTEDEVGADHEELSWDEFERELDQGDMVVARHGDDEYEVLARSEIVGPAIADADVEEALVEGETVETEITERKVVEQVIVEEATVQSEIADRAVIQSDIVDVQLLTSDVDHCTVSRTDAPDESAEAVSRLQPGTTMDETYDVEIGVDEGWSVTREVVERITIESRIVDTDVEETETVESDTLRETVDIEGVTETILEGELVASPETATRAVESGHVESQFREDDVIETHLIRRQTIDEEMTVRKEITGQVSESEVSTADTISHTVVESEIVDEADYDVDLAAAGTAGATAAGTGTGDAMVDEQEMAGTPSTAQAVAPTEDDEGKSVVNTEGDTIGMVVDVDDGRMYVDPSPSLTDRIRTALGWGDHDDDSYPVDPDHIVRIDEDEVVIGVEQEM